MRARGNAVLSYLGVGLTMLAGAGGVALSFRIAETAVSGDPWPYVVFWVSFAVAVLPLLALGLRTGSPVARVAAVAGAAAFTTWPKILRTWDGPLFSDEFGHMYQVRRVLEAGLFPAGDNPLLKAAPEFPLLHWLTAGMTAVGTDLWTAAELITAGAHVATLLGVYALVLVLVRSPRAAVIGAFLYILQPGWMFFSAQFAYETLALPLLLWTLVLALWARRQAGTRRTVALIGVVVLAGLTVLAHHFAAVVLAGLLLAVLLAGYLRAETDLRSRRGDAIATTLAVTVIASWLISRGMVLADYYGPTLGSAWNRLTDPVESDGTRQVFSGSQLPTFERWAGYGFPFAMLGLYAWSLLTGLRHFLTPRVLAVFTLLGASFFASLPLVFTVDGSEAAHRWWAYGYIGLAVVIGAGLDRYFSRERSRPRLAAPALAALVTVATIGGAASGITVAYRFPGPAEVGNDARSVSIEARQAAEWIRSTYGPSATTGTSVLADRYTAQQLVGYGLQRTVRPSPGYPAWDLLFTDDPARLAELAPMLSADQANLVVVDTRMTTDRPTLGYWFNRTEPGAFSEDLVPTAAIAKFDCAPWAQPVQEFGFLRIYRIDPVVLARDPGRCA